ncbi:unnamed protein product [Oppiella nova]|uniref:Replication termination factor 2 n=1 Tax=Oppiella nova TaxID=334625 RepID=A0A7R9MIF6_9ACAR|nr:unnamed protein product [Oppiella nova]CAG2177969.1 unnamed protein product [Oppiella nova]
MGCDGGTIPKRDELVRTKRKRERADRSVQLAAKWRSCAISTAKLVEPVVSCELGRLYNKDAVIEYLLDRESTPNGSLCAHIRSLKDVVTLRLTVKSDFNDKKPEIDGQYIDEHDSMYVCPVVGVEMNGKYKFCYIRSCGCVVSERALKEVKSDVCHKCNKEYAAEDVIVINGSDEEVKELENRMNERRLKAKESKKSRKRKATEVEVTDGSQQTSATDIPSTSSSSAASASAPKTSKPVDKSSKDYSVAKDPMVSETYKSLFTSHKSAKNRPTAHWVTFNPCYN